MTIRRDRHLNAPVFARRPAWTAQRQPLPVKRSKSHDRRAAGCDAGDQIYVFDNGTTTPWIDEAIDNNPRRFDYSLHLWH